MDWRIICAAILSGYLTGSLSFSRIITRIVAPGTRLSSFEVPVEGSSLTYKVETFGATSAAMQLGSKAGCAIGFADIFKAAAVVLAFRLIFPQQPYLLFAAIGSMAGHNWPLFYKFKGGRGISAYYGGLFIIDWVGALVTMFSGLLFGLLIVKDYFIAYMSGLWLIIPWLWFTTKSPVYIIYAVIINVIYIVASLPDIKQYSRIKKTTKVDPRMVLETNPMGRGMLKISEWISSIFRKKNTKNDND